MVDRRYGNPNKYGNGRLYGASDTPIVDDRFQWGVDVGWSSVYSGTNEAQYMTSLYVFRGRRSYLQPNGQGFAPVETGRARITLDNSSGRYDSWNTASALYPYVAPGVYIRVRLRDLDSGIIDDVFTGIVLDIETIGYGEDARVTLVCEDGWYFLRNTITYIGAVRQAYSVSRIMGLIFGNEAGDISNPFVYPWGTSFETSADTLKFWWSSNNITLANMVNEISQAYFGKFFIANDGVATYFDRSSARTSVATYAQSQFLKDIGNFQPWVNQRNAMRLKVHTRAQAANQVMWSLNEPIQVLNGTSVNITALLSYNGVSTPGRSLTFNPSIDYFMNTAEDGSGTDLTSGFIVKDTLSFRFGTGDTLNIEAINNSGSNGWITSFDVLGIPAYEVGIFDMFYPPNKPPQVRELFIDTIWYQNFAIARDLLDTYGPQIAAIRQFPIITFDTRPEGLTPDLFDIVTVSIAKLGISSTEFEVGGIEIQTTNETCQSFTVRQYLEPHLTG